MKKNYIKDIDQYQEIVFKPFSNEQDKLGFIKGCIGSMQDGAQQLEEFLVSYIENAKDDADGVSKVIEFNIEELGNQIAQTLFDMSCLVTLLGLPMSAITQFGIEKIKTNYPDSFKNHDA